MKKNPTEKDIEELEREIRHQKPRKPRKAVNPQRGYGC